MHSFQSSKIKLYEHNLKKTVLPVRHDGFIRLTPSGADETHAASSPYCATVVVQHVVTNY